MVVVPFLRNNPSAVMFYQRFIFSAKNSGENIRSTSGFFIAGNPFIKIPGWETPVFFTLFTLSTYGTVVSNYA
jgi:hypothetical protein